MTTNKFLEFNGKAIYFLAADGQYWVALKPICEALGVNYDRQYKNLKESPLLGQLYAKQHMVGADNRLRKMVSLPERYIYGWLFQIRSESPELIAYQKDCCDLLYNHFHGAIAGRKDLMAKKVQISLQRQELIDKLTQSEDYLLAQKLEAKEKQINKELRSMDKDLYSDQLSLFSKQ